MSDVTARGGGHVFVRVLGIAALLLLGGTLVGFVASLVRPHR